MLRYNEYLNILVKSMTIFLACFLLGNNVLLIYGSDSSITDLDYKQITISGITSREKFGFPSNAGDINNDGYDDFLIGQISGSIGSIFFGKQFDDWETNLTRLDAGVTLNTGGIPAFGGNINNDEYSDFLRMRPLGTGGVELYLGRKTTQWLKEGTTSYQNTTFKGETTKDRAGHGATGVGDVNNDGYDDLVIGALDNDEGGFHTGQTYLIFGSSTFNWNMEYSLALANASFIGDGNSDHQSSVWVTGAGDMNNDGFDDFAIGAWSGTNRYRKVYLIFGRATDQWKMDESLSQANISFISEKSSSGLTYSWRWLSGVGDVNNDSYDDLIFGDYFDEKTYLVFGRPDSEWKSEYLFTEANVQFSGENQGDKSGYSVAGIGDTNGDGFSDFLIGAYQYLSRGKVYLILGRPTNFWTQNNLLRDADTSFDLGILNDWFGYDISGAGDVDNNGLDDFLIGATTNLESSSETIGKAYLFLSKSTNTHHTVNPPSAAPFNLLGGIIAVNLVIILKKKEKIKLILSNKKLER